ncbi:MAG: Vacuolar protease A, partial [Pleopsidium flavum]
MALQGRGSHDLDASLARRFDAGERRVITKTNTLGPAMELSIGPKAALPSAAKGAKRHRTSPTPKLARGSPPLDFLRNKRSHAFSALHFLFKSPSVFEMKVGLAITEALYAFNIDPATPQKRSEYQHPLGLSRHSNGVYQYASPHGLLENRINMIHTTSIALGSPPQEFRALVDISWTDLFVPSTACESGWCKELSTYNSSESSSYERNGTAIEFEYRGVDTSGFLSRDTLQVAGIDVVVDMLFEEATSLSFGVMYHEMIFDSVLGLAPGNVNYAKNIMSPLSAMVAQGVLDENLFSLRMSRGDNDGPGELTLGGVNEDLYTGDMITMPVTNGTGRWPKGKWQVGARSLTVGDGEKIHQTFDHHHIAVLETLFPYIIVEPQLAEDLNELIGAEPIDWYPDSIPCERRAELPDLTIDLAGHNFTITPYDYTLELVIEKRGLRCLSSFIGLIEPGESVIVLGSAFLKAF